MKLSREDAGKLAKAMGQELPPNRKNKGAKKLANPGVPKATLYAGNAVFDSLCRAHGLPCPQSEYEWAKEIGRNFRADHCFDGWLLLEIQGGIYGRGAPCPACNRRPVGAHSSIKDMKRDIERQRLAVILGYQIFPCTPEEIEDGSIFPLIKRALASHAEQP